MKKKNIVFLLTVLAITCVFTMLCGANAMAKSEKETAKYQNPVRQELLQNLLEAHPDGSVWISLDGDMMSMVQEWLRNTQADEVVEQTSFYELGDGYTLCLTPDRTLELYNEGGWTLRSSNVDLPAQEEYEHIAIGSGSTYILQDEHLVEYRLGEERTITTLFNPNYIWSEYSEEGLQFVFMRCSGNLGIIYDGEFRMVTDDYGYGMKCYFADSSTIGFEYFGQDGKECSKKVFVGKSPSDLGIFYA